MRRCKAISCWGQILPETWEPGLLPGLFLKCLAINVMPLWAHKNCLVTPRSFSEKIDSGYYFLSCAANYFLFCIYITVAVYFEVMKNNFSIPSRRILFLQNCRGLKEYLRHCRSQTELTFLLWERMDRWSDNEACTFKGFLGYRHTPQEV